MKHMRKLLLLITLLFAVPAVATGCATLKKVIPVLAEINSLFEDANQTLIVIDLGVKEWARRTGPDESAIVKYEAIRVKAHEALRTAGQLLRAAQDLNQAQYDAAWTEFGEVFKQLIAWVEENGASSGGKMSVGGESMQINPPFALTYQVE